jgi:hypothetical protein
MLYNYVDIGLMRYLDIIQSWDSLRGVQAEPVRSLVHDGLGWPFGVVPARWREVVRYSGVEVPGKDA